MRRDLAVGTLSDIVPVVQQQQQIQSKDDEGWAWGMSAALRRH
jgi:hypothetical protein